MQWITKKERNANNVNVREKKDIRLYRHTGQNASGDHGRREG